MLLTTLKRVLLGAPIASQHEESHKLNVPLGLAVFSSDALSSTAYATDEILIALAASTYSMQAGLISLPVGLSIVGLIALVVISYRQVINAYPQGGGAYIVARENLGVLSSHVAAAALLIDYILTVSVSVTAGVAAITSTQLLPTSAAVPVAVVATLAILLINLRGIKESAIVIALPAYLFILSTLSLVVMGSIQIFSTHPTVIHDILNPATTAVTNTGGVINWTDIAFVMVFLKAFSHGCAGLTGIEAVSNGVKAFKTPQSANANKTMLIMGVLLATIFLGVTFLALGYGIMPSEHETIMSQVACAVFGKGSIMYYTLQFVTLIVLVIAANTAFAGFPQVSNMLANDGYLPRQLMGIGDRLVFSNGIVLLGFLSIALIILYNGQTHSLIPLYAVGVFISFTLSQLGMVVHHIKEKEQNWRWGIFINGVGGFVTMMVTIILAVEKFTEGAWIVLVAMPVLILMFNKIKAHYTCMTRQLALDDSYACPVPMKHKVIVLVSSLGKGTIPALQYAKTLSGEIEAVHVSINEKSTEKLQQEWDKWGCNIPLHILPSPYRSIIGPLMDYIEKIDIETPDDEYWLTVVVPEYVTKRFWHNFLHNNTSLMIKALLAFRKGKIVTTVRFHLEE